MCKTQINSLHLELTISLYLLTVLPSEVRVAISQGSKSSNPCSPIPLTIAPRARADIPLTSGTGSTRDFFRPGMILARYGERSYRRTNKANYVHAGDQILWALWTMNMQMKSGILPSELSSYLFEIPNDAYKLLSQILIGCSHSVKSTANNKKATLHFNMPMLNNFVIVRMADC